MTSTRPLATLFTAVGLALLLVVGAWSTSHGDADVHASLCLAPGASAGAGAAAGGHHDAAASSVATPDAAAAAAAADGSAISAVVVLWFLALVALVLLLARRSTGILHPRTLRPALVPRAGPRARPTALSLTELCLSRT